jgi:hypothetical protein
MAWDGKTVVVLEYSQDVFPTYAEFVATYNQKYGARWQVKGNYVWVDGKIFGFLAF